jgi:hypothetical protein
MSPRPIPQKTRERLAKLIPRLTSPHEGEVIATVAAIERTLIADGLDIHDLTAALTNGAGEVEQGSTFSGSVSHHMMIGDLLLTLIGQIRARSRICPLSARAQDFLRDLEARGLNYDKVFLTERQMTWLKELAQRAGVVKA